MGFSPAAIECVRTGVRPPVDAISDVTDQDTTDPDVIEIEQQEAVTPKQVPDVISPTAQEVKDHEITHIPFRNWCEHCVKGKSVERPYKSTDHTPGCIPCFHADYLFMGEQETTGTTPILVVKDDTDFIVFANVVLEKGAN